MGEHSPVEGEGQSPVGVEGHSLAEEEVRSLAEEEGRSFEGAHLLRMGVAGPPSCLLLSSHASHLTYHVVDS